ncbi:hypothetical protein [Clostridium porci]|uniref:Cell wall-binding protein n=1 Tax=Clostridium porci TaxID=2605778 RepID=A0A7X2TC21_9CLOT|nr:hypothetical protein [Clostridium porci]MSS36504.1 hypothetical protein [Clostridium porci]
MKQKILMMTVAAMSLSMAVPAFAAGWVKNGNTWYYTDSNGEYVTDAWRSSGNDMFYLGDDGVMVTNALIDTGSGLYYVDSTGKRVKDCWKELQDEYDDETYWYYFTSNGKAKESGYLTIDGVKYHFTDYHMDTGWNDGDDGNTYYFGEGNELYKPGWHYILDGGDNDYEPGWYYTDTKGKILKSQEKKIGNEYYVFNDNGLMCDGWVEFVDDETICKYYRLGNGDRMDGWIYHDGEDSFEASVEHPEGWYFLKSGRPYTADYRTTKISDTLGIAKINNKYYCFDEVGTMQYGIVKGSDGTLYYFGAPEDGAMKTGRVTVEYDDLYDYEGQTMYFNTSGAIGTKGSDFTGVKNNYLYRDGELVESASGDWEVVVVGGKSYVVNEYGKIKTSGTIRDDNDVRWRVQKKSDGTGYELVKID